MEEVSLRAVVFNDGGLWVAQCLEHDIGAQAKDLAELQVRLDLAIQAELKESMERHGKPFVGIEPAPKHFHAMWDRRSGSFDPVAVPKDRGDGAHRHLEMGLCA